MKKLLMIMLALAMIMGMTAACAEETAMSNEQLKIAIPGRDGDVINYTIAMMMLGAQPVVVWDEWNVDDFDGLLLPGGVDVHPGRYGQENVACGTIDEELDGIQFAICDAFIKAGKPVLGICRGHQLLNVYFSGTLIQDLENADHHKWTPEGDRVHDTTAAEGSFIADIYGAEFAVNSAHHQAVDTVGEGLVVVQHSDDGVIEAMYHESLPVISVQWHPERMCFDHARTDTVDGSLVLRHFLDMCSAK
ncbi:MAG: gamma-glutamyl-gamma-aminobutyrate hydrolase family protein [Clostridiales bacterium]|nr:gamma-glutamyl-gamma-aminobutyrate hydrolase family protein [Clostridiales bacterium]